MDVRMIDVRCAVCGELERRVAVTGMPSFGPPDLDLRPGGPARWALPFQVQRCDACGYCGTSVGEAPPGAGEVVASELYREVDRGTSMPRLARSLFCAALVLEAGRRPEASGKRFVEAAWACDNFEADEQARICRERAAEMLTVALTSGEVAMPRAVVQALVADLWRRARRWDEALDACDAVGAMEPGPDVDDGEHDSGARQVAAFIRELVEAGDDEPHSSAEAFAAGE